MKPKHSNLGQLTDVLSLVHASIYTAAQAGVQSYKINRESALREEELEHARELALKQIDFKNKELASNQEIAAQRDKIYGDILLYSLITVLVVSLLVGSGIALTRE